MNSVLFFVKGIGGQKRIFYEAAKIIKQHNNTYATVIEELDDLIKTTSTLSQKSDRVLLFSWEVIPLRYIKECCFENVYIYAGQTISKNQQLSCLHDHGIKVPKWLKNPSSVDEIFNYLGDRVIAKPDECGAFTCKLVHEINRHDFVTFHKKRWLYSEYVGNSEPPYNKYRVTAMFGNTIYAYQAFSPDSPIIRCFDSQTVKVTDDAIIEIGNKASRIMTDMYGCGMVGIDMTKNENGIYVIEANPTSIGLWLNIEKIDSRFHKPTNIANACINEIDHLKQ